MIKKVSLGIIILAALALAYIFVVQPFIASNTERQLDERALINDDYTFSFNYFSGEDGYEFIESGTSDRFLQSYVMIQKDDFSEFQSDSDKVPPTMSVFVFTLPEFTDENGEKPGRVTRLQNWAQANAGITAFDQIYGTPDVIELDGVKSLEYSTDGVYQQTVYLASYRGFIYMFVGQYDRPTDPIKQDFESLVASVTFR